MIERSSRPPSQYAWHCLTTGLGDIQSRARRAEYGSFFLFSGVYLSLAAAVQLGLLAASGTAPAVGTAFVAIFTLWVLAALTTVSIRRLHDLGHSGWLVLIVLIPVVGFAVMLAGIVVDGDPSTNEFGESPKYRHLAAI